MSRIWAGIDRGKGHHHGLALTADGKTLLSRRVANDEPELLKLIGDVLDLADGRPATWAIDMTGGEPALLLTLLINHGQKVLYGDLRRRRPRTARLGQGQRQPPPADHLPPQAPARRLVRRSHESCPMSRSTGGEPQRSPAVPTMSSTSSGENWTGSVPGAPRLLLAYVCVP